MENFDVCIIGAGPGGYVAAIHAARNGAKVALIEKENYGGTCLNVGCIPTKTLIAAAEILRQVKNAGTFGIKIDGIVTFDWNSMLQRKNSVIEKLRNGISSLLKNAGVQVHCGIASFKTKNTICITNSRDEIQKINTQKIIIATGSKPTIPKFIPNSPKILNSTDLLNIQSVPKSMIIVGGGVIGCEFASLFSELGTEITIVEMMPEILPGIDLEISKQLAREFKKRRITILTGNPIENIKSIDNNVTASAGGKELSAEYMLISIGRSPFTERLKPENAGLKISDKGFLPVDSKCKTNVDGIYAIGDVTGRIQLAHLASAMGICAANNATGKESEFSDKFIPNCIFTNPEIASVGLTQEQCITKEIPIKIGKFPYTALGKALAINEQTGFCKIIADANSDKILGVHIIGAHATDLIAEATTAIESDLTAKQLGKIIHAHPTLGELMMETAHAVHEKSVHIPVIPKTKQG